MSVTSPPPVKGIDQGGAIDPTPRPDPHPPGPRLLIGGMLSICPYCDGPHRVPIGETSTNANANANAKRSSPTTGDYTGTPARAHRGVSPPTPPTPSTQETSPSTTAPPGPKAEHSTKGGRSCAAPPTQEKNRPTPPQARGIEWDDIRATTPPTPPSG
jgi:hypothetical protein